MIDELLQALPPYEGIKDIIVEGEQDITDIEREVIEAHKKFSADYDCIVDYFDVANPLEYLFDFCKRYLPYRIENEGNQTTRSAGGILATAETMGVDCKHLAGWIGGILDAMNRKGIGHYDWAYRFASYKLLDPDPEHVFIVVKDHDGEIWIDPAPIESALGFVKRTYNDRKIVPNYFKDKKIPMLARLRGICCEPYSSINTVYAKMGLLLYGQYGEYRDINTYLADEYSYTGAWHIEGDNIILDDWFIDEAPSIPFSPDIPETINEPQSPVHIPYYDSSNDLINKLQPETLNQEDDRVTIQGNQDSDNDLKVNFDLMEFIRANPVESVVIGVGVGALVYLAFRKKKKTKRA